MSSVDKKISQQRVAPISTVTWEDSLDENLNKERKQRMIQKNPWLGGSFIQQPNGGLQLAFNRQESTVSTIHRVLHIVDDDVAYEVKCYRCVLEQVTRYIFRPGQDTTPGQPVWKVTLICPSIIVVSMSHILGDDHTYYALFRQLITGDVSALH